jgi:hypothetical protein
MKLPPLVSLCLFWAGLCVAAEDRAGTVQLFYRMIGSHSNGPFVQKTRTVAARDGAPRTGMTGMANAGFTEYPFCAGRWSFTFREHLGLFPRIASHVPIDASRVNTCDMLIDWVYEPDGCVWGPACRTFGQTFVARRTELVAVTFLVASPRGTFRVSVREKGPGGLVVAPARSVVSGHSMEWASARWRAGEVSLAPGKTYCVVIDRDDGKAWNPYFHASGNVYDAGHAFFDGEARPESDLALWIMEEPDDLSRAVVEDAGVDEWVRGTTGVRLAPRTPNLRLITVKLAPVTTFCVNLVAFVWDGKERRRLLCGPKYCVACARPDSAYDGAFLFGPDELPCRPGTPCFVEIFTVPFEEGAAPVIPGDRSSLPLRDLRVLAYGETAPGARPVIANLAARFTTNRSLALSWQLSAPGSVMIDVPRIGDRAGFVHVPPAGATEAVLTGIPAGVDCDFRLLAFGAKPSVLKPSRYVWRTPLYRVRSPGGEPAPRLWPETPPSFVPLAPRPAAGTLRADPPVYGHEVAVDGGDFESGLGAWKETKPGTGGVSGPAAGITPFRGERMYGWTHRAGAERRDVLLENGITQTVPTVPGHWYEFSLRAVTDVGAGPRGDTRIRLAVDAEGGERFTGANASQWYWTDGRWLRLSHRFRARSDRATLYAGLFRWRDLDRASAYIDGVRLWDLGSAPEQKRVTR